MMEREQRLEKSDIPNVPIKHKMEYSSREAAVLDLKNKGLVIGVGPFKNVVYKREGSNLIKVGKLR